MYIHIYIYIYIYVIEEWKKVPIGPNQKLVSPHNSCKNILRMAHCMNLIVQTLTSLSFISILKACFNLCITIFLATLSNIFKPPSWLNFTSAMVIKSWKTSRFIGSRCYHQWKESWMNPRSWLLRWLKTM